MEEEFCTDCFQHWRRLTPPMECGDPFLSSIRSRLSWTEFCRAVAHLKHFPNPECCCSAMNDNRNRVAMRLAQFQLFGSIYLPLDEQEDSEYLPSSATVIKSLSIVPIIAGSLRCDLGTVLTATRLLHEGARAVSFSLDGKKTNKTRDGNNHQNLQSIISTALREWQRLCGNISPLLPRERLQVEIDLSSIRDLEMVQMVKVLTLYSSFASLVRQKVRAILFRLSPELCQPTLISALAHLHQACNAAEPLSMALCLVVDVPRGYAMKVIPQLMFLEQVIVQGSYSVAGKENPNDNSIGHMDNPYNDQKLRGNDQREEDISECFWACIRFHSPSQLCPTVVTDAIGTALGFVYTSKESLKQAIQKQKGIYHSRRHGLWQKGETSGSIQRLRRIDLDCDKDCLRFSVDQMCPNLEIQRKILTSSGSFCHRGCRTDWGDSWGIRKLLKTLEQRQQFPLELSYTNRLFNDPNLLGHKLIEEAQEVIEASTIEDLAAEAADLLYFLMVRCVAGGVSIEDIERHLDAKSLKILRRAGDAKESRIQKAQKICNRDSEK